MTKAHYFNCRKCGGPGADEKGGLCSNCKQKEKADAEFRKLQDKRGR